MKFFLEIFSYTKILTPFFLALSPFYLEYPPKKEPTNEDFQNIDQMLDSHLLENRLKEVYNHERGLCGIHEEDFFRLFYQSVLERMGIALRMRLSDPLKLEQPSKKLIKINRGGRNLVVSCVGFGKRRPKGLLERLKNSLEKTGFDGYLYYRIGGYPTPRGFELNLSATPYAFKIFLMEEAKQLGFQTILWVDARLVALKNITPLFSIIRDTGGLFNSTHTMGKNNIFLEAQKAILALTKTSYEKNRALATPVFGLNMQLKEVENLIDGFYTASQLGTPFLSCYPEEIVLSALLEKHFSRATFLNELYPEIWKKLYLYSPNAKMDQKLAVFSKSKNYYFFGISNEGANSATPSED
jgi:hypothetical protein